ncbi:MAG: undecaprenyl-diphosphate phosphatase, partial [Alphaproteobacteria bacterium]
MTLIHIIVLAMVQGITEFLPISSSAHLILVPIITDWRDQGLMIDVAVHVGTLAAVMVYFWRECWSMALGMFNLLRLRGTREGRLVLYIALATLPII